MLKIKKISEDWSSFYKFLDQRFTGVSTGVSILDETMLGLRGITGISGQPGTNKSTLATQIAHHYARNHGPVFFYDRENGFNRLRLRMLCQYMVKSEIDLTLLRKEKSPLLDIGAKAIKSLPFYVITAGEFKSLRNRIDQAVQEGHKPLLVIDSINKLQHDLTDRRASIDQWLVDLDEMKVYYEQKLKTILTIERNYSGYEKHDLGGSKDSSEIEYTVESLLNLRHHPESNKKIICRVAKDRDGVRGIDLHLELKFSDKTNDRSFCYLLEGAKVEDEEF